MKFLTAISLIYLLNPFNLFLKAQENSLDFFPYHEGDVWQYFVGNDEGSSIETLTITNIDTVADTLHYLFYNNDTIPKYKININSNIVYEKHLWESDFYPLYELNIPVDSFWVSDSSHEYWTYYYSIESNTYFGASREVRLLYVYYGYPIGVFNVNPQVGVWLVENIGLYKEEYDGGNKRLLGCIIAGSYYGTISGVDEVEQNTKNYQIKLNNYPNPFNSQTILEYKLSEASEISIKIYNSLGQIVEIVYEGYKFAGTYEIVWNAGNYSSGIYIAVISTEKSIVTNKLIFLK